VHGCGLSWVVTRPGARLESARVNIFPFLMVAVALPCSAAHDWPQDLGNAQRTGYTAESPQWPWTFAWTWNGPDGQGGTNGHRYHQPRPHDPWEARIAVGGGLVFAPAGKLGLYALRVKDGSVAWQFTNGTCHTTPAFNASSGAVFVGTEEGVIQKLDSQTGKSLARFATGSVLNKSLLLAAAHLYVVTRNGVLHQLEGATLKLNWKYRAKAAVATLPAWSARHDAVVFCTDDLRVHCVAGRDGTERWRTKPTPLNVTDGASFDGGWPVIAEECGVVFVRLAHGGVDATLWSGGGPKGKWPTNNTAIRQRLIANPRLKNLFALRLEDGLEAFIPAVGPAGVEDLRQGRPWLRPHAFPVIGKAGARDVAYVPWRNGDTRDLEWDGRWDSHLGEMVLDHNTVPGLVAGDLRFVQFQEHGGWMHITDESCPLSMAGDVLFSAHWDVSQAARITDRSPTRGHKRASPILTEKRPPVARHLRLAKERIDVSTDWATGGLQLTDGRYLDGPGWWVYANLLDPPTPTRDAYSEGILPRYTCVANGHIFVQGNGGELFVLRHSGVRSPAGP
jgi:hypothetical protein